MLKLKFFENLLNEAKKSLRFTKVTVKKMCKTI